MMLGENDVGQDDYVVGYAHDSRVYYAPHLYVTTYLTMLINCLWCRPKERKKFGGVSLKMNGDSWLLMS